MQKTLDMICFDMGDLIRNDFDLGPGDAADLVKAVWAKMTNGPNGKDLQKAVELIEETFGL